MDERITLALVLLAPVVLLWAMGKMIADSRRPSRRWTWQRDTREWWHDPFLRAVR